MLIIYVNFSNFLIKLFLFCNSENLRMRSMEVESISEKKTNLASVAGTN
jgi:hypothetical protein